MRLLPTLPFFISVIGFSAFAHTPGFTVPEEREIVISVTRVEVGSRFDDAVDGPEAGLIQTLSSVEAFSAYEIYLFVKIKNATDLTE